jgi:hypothetical protein
VLLEEPVELDGKRYMAGFNPEYVRLVMELPEGRGPEELANHFYRGTVGVEFLPQLY